MNKENFENKAGTLENRYQRYLELGGIINEEDFQSALDRMGDILDREDPSTRARILQAIGIAKNAGIELSGSESSPDPRVVLYVILRSDFKPENVKYHHNQMYDERIFGEVLRMLGDADSLDKLVKAYPDISFEYKRGK